MPHVLVAGKIHLAGIERMEAAGDITMTYIEDTAPAAMDAHLGTAEAIILRTQPFGTEQISAAPGLRIAARHGVGYDMVDVSALSQRSIPLAIVGDVNTTAVAEHAMMMILAAMRRAKALDGLVGADWQARDRYPSREAWGKTLLLVGFGRIGRCVARLAAAFDMKILAHDPFLDDTEIAAHGVEPARDLDAALVRADAISLRVPTTESRPILNADRLAAVKPGIVIVNTSRGGLIDEAALIAALDDGRVWAAGLDVFAEEPPAFDNPLLGRPDILLSPHSAGLTDECAARMSLACAENVIAAFAGSLDANLVVNAREIGWL